METTPYNTPAQSDETPPGMDWQHWLRTVVLFGMGVYLVFLIISGSLLNYINIRFAWLTYVAAALFFLLGAVSLYGQLRGLHIRRDPTAHTHLTWAALLVASLPLLLGMLVPSQPLGVEAAAGRINFQPVGGEAAAVARDPLDRSILDWLRAFHNTPNAAVFNGDPVDLIGFVYREPGFGEDFFMVARFTISCCVADAQAIGIPVEYAQMQDLQDGQWVRVRGTLQAGQFRGQMMPIIQPESVEPVDQPEAPYLFS